MTVPQGVVVDSILEAEDDDDDDVNDDDVDDDVFVTEDALQLCDVEGKALLEEADKKEQEEEEEEAKCEE